MSEKIKVLVVGNGGREHALAWKLAQSPRADVVFCAPGNAGTATETALSIENVDVPPNDADRLVDFARDNEVGLTVVGPEAPLVAGVVDRFIAAGLRYLDYTEQALELAQGIFDMASQQPYHRPPELFCGFDRVPNGSPVRYPVACTPQAWATGAMFQLLQVMVNLIPDAHNNRLRIVHPSLPETIQYLSLKNLKIGQTMLDLEFEQSNGATACRVVRKRGNLRVTIEA